MALAVNDSVAKQVVEGGRSPQQIRLPPINLLEMIYLVSGGVERGIKVVPSDE